MILIFSQCGEIEVERSDNDAAGGVAGDCSAGTDSRAARQRAEPNHEHATGRLQRRLQRHKH